MAFNWFNRFKKENDAEQQSEPTTPEPESTPDVESEATEKTSSPEAQIAYAKAMLENIKKRQQQEKAHVEPQEPTPPEAVEETSEVVAEPAPDIEVPEETIDTTAEFPSDVEAPEETIEPVESTETVQETVATSAPEIAPGAETLITEPAPETPAPEIASEPASDITTSEPTPEPETPQVAASLPFWAQADADRQARLERLRATAIEEPEPEPVATETASDDEVIPLTIDEGFLWSAEVLAAMGRRADQVSIEEITWLKRLRQGLSKTRRSLINQLKAIVGQGPLNQDAVDEIESLLLQADAGVEATDKVIEALQGRMRQETLPPDKAIAYLKQILRDLLDQPLQGSHSAFFAPEKDTLNIWLITGVNGAGKTTTIGKLAHISQKSGYKCLIAAADTFRAAAVEQVKVWGQRSDVEVIANPGKNTDPAAVVFDAITAAQSRNTELLLVDTAGRLQNKKNLMDELTKVRRIIDKKAGNAKVESLLVLDATLGQNGLRQAEVFSEAAQLSGVILTKLDGTAKGGIALAVVEQLGLPIRFIGAGEGIEDLRPFSSYEFVEALISG
jgi:fused signal recognition particle receptor